MPAGRKTRQPIGTPLQRSHLTGGPGQLVVIPDETHGAFSEENWDRLGRKIVFAHLPLPATEFTYHYRLIATIALAEISRQVGRRPALEPSSAPRRPFYDRALERVAEATGERIRFEHLLKY